MRAFLGIAEREKIVSGNFSPFFEGFSSFNTKTIEKGIDVLIISESIGNLKHHQSKIEKGEKPQQILKDYYLGDPIETFNQWATREILELISKKRKNFYFTDVVKCYVKKEGKNFERAAEQCAKNYLKKQVEMLKPKIVILLGKRAREMFNKEVFNKKDSKLNHGEVFTSDEMKIVYSEFPSRWTVDQFFKGGGIDKLKSVLLKELS